MARSRQHGQGPDGEGRRKQAGEAEPSEECRPWRQRQGEPPALLADSGRGLLLVETLADRWEILDREPPGKTVRAEIDLPRWLSLFKHQVNHFS